MKKAELISDLASHIGITKVDAGRAIDALATITRIELTRNGEMILPGIGKLKVSERAARTARNPKTGEAVQVPAINKIKFVTASDLKVAIQ